MAPLSSSRGSLVSKEHLRQAAEAAAFLAAFLVSGRCPPLGFSPFRPPSHFPRTLLYPQHPRDARLAIASSAIRPLPQSISTSSAVLRPHLDIS